MNSSSLIETPKKKYISVKSLSNPPSFKTDSRFSPSKSLLKLLTNAARIHSFQFHIEVEFTNLSAVTFLDRKLVDYISEYFNSESPDVPDLIVKLEIIALEESFFGIFLKEYISEEFSIPSEYSFCVFAVLNYMKLFELPVEDALCDIFKVSSSELSCEICITGAGDKSELARRINCSVLRSKLDFDCLDDSYDDPDFNTKVVNQDTSDDSEDVYSFVDESDFFNPFVKETSNNSFCNPFQLNESVSPSQQPVESTPDGFNPFAASSPKVKKRAEKENKNVCSHCDAKFSSSYNMKQHMISIHKIFSPGMKIYKCDFSKCNFVTGSRIMFARHNHSKSVQIVGNNVKPSCPVCHAQFFNSSSLKRHIKRKMHNN